MQRGRRHAITDISKSKCYPSYRLDGVNRYTASGPHVAPAHQPVNHHTTITKATVAGAGSDPSHKSVEE